jgi:hypothetical protein
LTKTGEAPVDAGRSGLDWTGTNDPETPMRLTSLLLIAAAVGLVAQPAEAARNKRSQAVQSAQTTRGEAGVVVRRSRTRITVTRRSYLDAGTEVYPGSQPYTDYVFSPNYFRPADVAFPPIMQNSSLPPPLWIPSYHTPNWGY